MNIPKSAIRRLAKGRLPKTVFASKLEERYAAHLETRKLVGEIVWWLYEPASLKLGNGARFTPDFGVMLPDGVYQFHETKGHFREAALVRLKVAAALHPFQFIAVRFSKDGGFTYEDF